MMKKNMKKKSTARKLLPAAGMLAVSASMLATSTYAWFTMNKEVALTGMEVKTKVGDSLLIANSTAGTGHASENTFGKGTNFAVSGMLQPVSTISGANNSFFYTYDAKADGSKATDTEQVAYNALTNNTITIDTDDYVGYVDYVVELKAINSNSSTAKQLRLTELNLLYDGVVLTDHAYRIAIFEQDNTGSVASPAYTAIADSTAANNIFAYTGFDYFGTDATAEGVASTTDKGTISPAVNAAGGWTKDIDAATTDYTKLTVRLWLEGEDTDCYSSKFLTLTKEWTLDMKFELADTTTATTPAAATVINSGIKASASAAGVASLKNGDDEALDGVQITGYQWYKDNLSALPDTAEGGTTATLTGATAGNDYYCVITTEKGTKYRTNSITYTP